LLGFDINVGACVLKTQSLGYTACPCFHCNFQSWQCGESCRV